MAYNTGILDQTDTSIPYTPLTIGDAAPAAGEFPANHKYYEREFIEIAAPERWYDQFGMMKAIPSNSSNVIVFNKVDKLPTLEDSPLLEGDVPTAQQPQMSRIEKAIDQFGGFLETTDRLSDESINGLTSEFNTRIAEQAGETMNKVIRDDLLGGTNVRYSAASGAPANRDAIDTAGLATADFQYIFESFKNEKVKPFSPISNGSTNIGTVPTAEGYPVVVPVEAAQYLDALDDGNGNKFQNVETYSAHTMTWPNEYGRYRQFRFILDTEASTVVNAAGTPQDVALGLVFGKMAYAVTSIAGKDTELIIKPLGSAGTADPLNQISTIGWKARQAAIIVQQTYMFRLEFSIGDN